MFKQLTILLAGLLSSCAGSPPTQLGLKGTHLSPCPNTPNCVSSNKQDANHFIDSIKLIGPVADSWKAMINLLEQLPGCTIKTQTDTYCHAECRSRLFGFVDDLELHLNVDTLEIAIRSAARVGYSDFGVNRTRITDLNNKLIASGIANASKHHE